MLKNKLTIFVMIYSSASDAAVAQKPSATKHCTLDLLKATCFASVFIVAAHELKLWEYTIFAIDL